MKLLGWTSAYTSGYKPESFTKEHERLLVECIQRRHYEFNHADHMFLDYAAPFYDTGKICVLTKHEWDEVMSKAYATSPHGRRLMPEDTIKRSPINYVLYERKEDEPHG
jgi:hypothetical protein